MAQFFSIHPNNPQSRLIRQAVAIVRAGGVIVYPTDSCYAFGCQLGDKSAMTRIRTIRHVDEQHYFSLVCRDLTEISHYAKINNSQYRLLKTSTPGTVIMTYKASMFAEPPVVKQQSPHLSGPEVWTTFWRQVN